MHDGTEGLALHEGQRLTSLLADVLVGTRFVPVWIATGVLMLLATFIAPEALQSTSWAFVLPYMTVLAVAALGQMLVIMHAGIDLSTPGVMFLGGYLIVGVGHGSNDRLALAILACLGLGVLVGLINGILVAILQLNPLIVTLAVGQIVFAEGLHYSNGLAETDVPSRLSDFAQNRPIGIISLVFWVGAGITLAVALLLRYMAPGRRFQAVGANPKAAWMAGVRGSAARGRANQRRPEFRRRLSARADRRRRHRRRVALGRAGERNLDLGSGACADAAEPDAADPRPLRGVAVHRLRRGDHRRNAHLRRPSRVGPRASSAPKGIPSSHRPKTRRKHELRSERRHDARTKGQ